MRVRCRECKRPAVGRAKGRRAYLIDGELLIFCVLCAYREFGPLRPDSGDR